MAELLAPNLEFSKINTEYKYHQYAEVLASFLCFLCYPMPIDP